MIELQFDEKGLVPAIAQDNKTGEVLMAAFMDRTAWERTLSTGYVHYWSRSRQKLWKKGESSGHAQRVIEVRVDCDRDCVLVKIEQIGGAACHTGFRSCFYRKVEGDALRIDGEKVFNPEKT